MEAITVRTDNGNIQYSRITVETVIFIVLRDIKEIVGPKKTVIREITNKLVKGTLDQYEDVSKEIRIETKGDSVTVNLFLMITYGVRIPDLTWKIQSKIKERLKETTGLDIDTINVHIQGIHYPRKYRQNKRLVSQETILEII